MSAITFDPKSPWQSSFTFDHVKCLIVCRGPIRLETMEVFLEMGAEFGMLLSEKDSIIYPQTIAPELRILSHRRTQVHHVPDYMGSSKEERVARIDQIINICHKNQYTHLFAGYGFMAEDAEFISRVEKAHLCFVGPNSRVIQQAGSKDEAKQLARALKVSVTPGEDRITALTLLRKAGDNAAGYFGDLIKKNNLKVAHDWKSGDPLDQAEKVLQAAYSKQIDLFSIAELQEETRRTAETIWNKNPGKRIRLKHIGGGGGKGQRVVTSSNEISDAVMAVLIESKATSIGDNKNFLIELNIENTRHNEIQLLGNGHWCIELGGRDCSLQMHEQKLLEVSLTKEMLEETAQKYESEGKIEKAAIMRSDGKMLAQMCQQAEDFGDALNLDSVSTFECIVEDEAHYFMEVNTRIQVEHRVTEMAYRLHFTNPDDPNDYFEAESLVAVMLLIACYGEQVPRPERIPRYISGIEARLNATNPALKPHAGGIVRAWSAPGEHEQRDDQGISRPNPDTGLVQPYNLAGAYDSNVALSITHGVTRHESFEKLAEILRCMELRGHDLHLNVDFHYGLLHWLMGNDSMIKPNTSFVSSYLALAGKLKGITRQINIESAWKLHREQVNSELGKAGVDIFDQKLTLMTRPLKKLLENPHKLMGWLAFRKNVNEHNPIQLLADLYHFLRLEQHPGVPPSEQIWKNDQKLLECAIAFYKELQIQMAQPSLSWEEMKMLLEAPEAPASSNISGNQELWKKVQAAHKGHQLGTELLLLPVILAQEANYYGICGNDNLEVEIDEEFQNSENREKYVMEMAPPPKASSDEILAWTGGTFYSRETPDSEEYVQEGQHVEEGDIIGILEVMKMFNPIHVEFAGTIRKKCVNITSGGVVARGQVLFKIDPDVAIVVESVEGIYQRQQEQTEKMMQKVFFETGKTT